MAITREHLVNLFRNISISTALIFDLDVQGPIFKQAFPDLAKVILFPAFGRIG